MNIQIVENIKEALYIVINCRKIDDEFMRLKWINFFLYLYKIFFLQFCKDYVCVYGFRST